MKNFKCLCWSFVFLCLLHDNVNAQVAPTAFYISVKGNDKADGKSLTTPFATVERAKDAIRNLKQTGKYNSPVRVFLRGGVYNLKQPLKFDEKDSGTPAHPITYSSYNNEKVIISGGQSVSGWKPYKNGIWVAHLPAPLVQPYEFKELYVNGKMRPLAKSPNTGFFKVKSYPLDSSGAAAKPFKSFEYHKGEIDPQWPDITNAEVVVYHFWKDTHLPVASVNPEKNTVTFKYGSGRRFSDDKDTKIGARYFIQNIFNALDTAGEWYLNKKENTIYYYPMAGEDMQKVTVTAPVLTELVHLEGNAEKREPLTYLNFRNIDFEHCGWILPPGNINNPQGSAAVTGAITLKAAQYCNFEDCTIRNISNFAFDMQNGSAYNSIRNCEMFELGAGGVKINGGREKDHPLLATGDNTISDNTIKQYGKVFPSAVGIFLLNTNNNLVSHNSVHDGFYTGISVGIIYDYLRSVSNYNIIEYNHIYNIGKGILSDMGGIYTLGVSPGTIVRNNLIHDIKAYSYGGWGIYCDEASSFILIENNIVYNTQFAPFNIHYSRELLVKNNIFSFGDVEQLSRSKKGPFKSMYFEKNIIYWRKGALLKYWKPKDLMRNDWDDYAYKFFSGKHGELDQKSTYDMDYNLYYNPSLKIDSVKMVDKTWAQWQSMGKDVHSVYADPMFIDADKYDFRLKANSPAFALGFRAIDMQSVGPRKNSVK